MGQPTVTPIQERRHAWGFMVGELADGMFSRDQITIAAGSGVCTAGLVLALAAPTVATAAAVGANTGNPTFGVINATTSPGVYELQMADATHFVVENPDGVELGHGQLGQPFNAGGLSFTLAAGGTACVAGDSQAITVPTSTAYVVYDPTIPSHLTSKLAILGSELKDATTTARKAAALTGGPSKVNASELVYGPNVTTTNQQTAALAQLRAQGIRSA